MTPERLQLMVDLRAQNKSWGEILAAVNALPGARIGSTNALSGMYFGRKVHGKLPAPTQPAPGMAQRDEAVTAPAPPAKPDEAAHPSAALDQPTAQPPERKVKPARMEAKAEARPDEASAPGDLPRRGAVAAHWAEIEQWAAAHGLKIDQDLSLGVVNARRAQLRLPPFKLARGR
jgi:hypothetical protein